MKIELKRETREDLSIWYCIYIDGSYYNSYLDKESAEILCRKIFESKNKPKSTETILTLE